MLSHRLQNYWYLKLFLLLIKKYKIVSKLVFKLATNILDSLLVTERII